MQATFHLLRNRPPEPPSRINPSAPYPLEVICLKCLEKDPARRYASAEAFADDLKSLAGGKVLQSLARRQVPPPGRRGALGAVEARPRPRLAGALATATSSLALWA